MQALKTKVLEIFEFFLFKTQTKFKRKTIRKN
jgi:hypothetical protein